ncbi:mechanosensitive ion channel domain-containing protein [uncultured Ferrimonas sp.]|uniref:mechanosensitive ion channel domain-containing protein n=1 Tax=uncultured Ferrimonas sp. TaxID=432640 RepID=UPI002626690B|nr:mechanosensitive ion channel domain-containing protein [uncultured Ferrimonas sp.]
MWRSSLFCLFLLLTFTSQAAGPFSLERRLNPFGVQQGQAITLAQWQQQSSQLQQQGQQHQQLLEMFSQRQAQLQQQLQQPLSSQVDPSQDLSQQSSMAHNQLQQLKTSSNTLTERLTELRGRLDALPDAEQQANQQWQLAQQQNNSSPIAQAQQRYFRQLEQTLILEQQALPRQIQLLQLQQRLVQSQQADLELRLRNLSNATTAARRAQSRAAITSAYQGINADTALSRLSEQNANYARALAEANGRLEQINRSLIRTEQQHQSLSAEHNITREQLDWPSNSAGLGQALIQRLKRLQQNWPTPLDGSIITQSRVNRYDYELKREKLQRQLQQPIDNNAKHKLVERQYQLLQQLLQANEQLMVDFSRLKLQQDQLTRLNQRFQDLITENMLWLANARPLDSTIFSELWFSLTWLFDGQRLQELQQSINHNSLYWSWWLLLVVFLAAVLDLSRNRLARSREAHARFVGNVTQDKFSASTQAMALAFGYSLLLPAPLWVAGLIFYHGDGSNFAHAVGAGLLGLALVGQFYWLLHQLCHPNGLLVAHFRRNPPLVARTLAFLARMHVLGAPAVAIIALTQVVELTQLRDSLGRLAFIGLCLLLFSVYRQLAKFAEEYHRFHSHRGTNRRLLERLLWQALTLLPLLALALTVQGYYYSAQQALGQAQITVTVGALYLLSYLMVKRRILIERRRLQLAQARAKRAELLAQREKDKVDGNLSIDGTLDMPEEPQIDLDTISTQSLGLMRSVLILAFVFSLVALWSQTHPAVFSFLDSITLYSSSQMIGGVEQALPITLKSIVAAALFGGFSYLIASNLPGLLELVILQRLDLTPGTGFAISTISKYLVYLFGTIATFSALGLAWSQMQWLIAALTVGLGFGLQEIFANFISGLIILFEKPIRIGDTVTIRDLTGTVSKIQIRATTIVDWDRKEIIVPNKAFITEQLVNWSLSDAITRVILKVSVARESDPALVDAVLHQAVSECPLALEQPAAEIFFDGFTGHTQNFEVRVYADEMGKRWPLRHDLHMRINAKFKDAGIVMAYPQMDLHINNEVKETGLIRS